MNNKYFFLKLLKYFLIINKNNQNQIINFFNFYNNFLNFKNIDVFLFNNILKFKFIFFNQKNKFLYSFYKNYFSYKNVLEYKNYFFINNKYFTYNNWIYFYKFFVLKLNIKFILFLDSFLHYKFYNKISNLNIPIIYINNFNIFKNINYLDKYIFKNIFLINLLHNYIFLKNKNFLISKFFFIENFI